MKETFEIIDQMVRDGVILEYAIGGAVAAIYYLEPFDTADLDIFVQVEATGSDFAILEPIFKYLTAHGHKAKGEFIYIEGIPVLFLPVFNALIEEAVGKAQTIKYAGVTTRSPPSGPTTCSASLGDKRTERAEHKERHKAGPEHQPRLAIGGAIVFVNTKLAEPARNDSMHNYEV